MASFTLKTLLGIADQTTSAAGGEEKPAATTKAEPSLFAVSDKKIMDLIYESHVHTEQSYDDASLFAVVENILNHTTRIVDKVVQVFVHQCFPLLFICLFSFLFFSFLFSVFFFIFLSCMWLFYNNHN